MNTASNVIFQTLATGAVADGISLIKTDLTRGLIMVGIGILLYTVYEYFPDKERVK